MYKLEVKGLTVLNVKPFLKPVMKDFTIIDASGDSWHMQKSLQQM
jgi:hypothetical protein